MIAFIDRLKQISKIMQINWYGLSLFQIITKPEKNSQIKIVIDPFDKEAGLKVTRFEPDILLSTQKNKGGLPDSIKGNPFSINIPGEYEIKNVFIQGIPALKSDGKNQTTIYVLQSEDIKICHLGNFEQKALTDEQLEAIGDIDILMVPVGDNFTLSCKEAAKVMSDIEPRITIPMQYHLPHLKVKLDPLDKFLKVFGIKSLSPLDKLLIKKKEIPIDEAKIVTLKN